MLLLVTRYDVKVEWVVCPLLASVAAEAKALPPAMTEIASRTVPAIRLRASARDMTHRHCLHPFLCRVVLFA